MKAAVHTRYGPPDVVRVVDVPRPTPGDDELLVQVHATTVNRTDCAYRAARPFFMRVGTGLVRPKATILGNEFAGVVEAVGSAVSSFMAGDRVFGYVEGRFGAHAEHLTVPDGGSIARMPTTLSFAEAAPLTEGGHYALAFIRWSKVDRGDHVLVYGATGAIGSAAVQLLKSRGVQVTAVCPPEHVALVEGLGADRVIDTSVEQVAVQGSAYDAVFDAVGKSSFARWRAALQPNGVYLSSELGRFAQNPALALATAVLPGRSVRFPFPADDQAMIRRLGELAESGDFRPVIDRQYPLDRIVEAYRYVETGQKVGNVVIDVRADG